MIKPYIYLALALMVSGVLWFTYNAGKQSVLQNLSSDRVEVLKDGRKIDADVLAADDDGLICLLIECEPD